MVSTHVCLQAMWALVRERGVSYLSWLPGDTTGTASHQLFVWCMIMECALILGMSIFENVGRLVLRLVFKLVVNWYAK